MQPQHYGPTIVLQAPPKRTYQIHEKSVRGISITILVLGIICFLLQIVGSAIGIGLGAVGAGIWCGVFFILTGSFGVSAAKQKTKCKIVTFMVLCIINASIFSVALLNVATFGMTTDLDDRYDCGYHYDPWNEWYDRDCSVVNAGIGLNITMLVSSIVVGIMSIIGSALSCGAFCCGNPAHFTTIPQPIPTVTPQVGSQQQVLVLIPSQTYPGHYTLGYDNAAFGNQAVPVRRQTPPPSYHNVGQGQPPRGMDYPAVHQAIGNTAPQEDDKTNLV